MTRPLAMVVAMCSAAACSGPSKPASEPPLVIDAAIDEPLDAAIAPLDAAIDAPIDAAVAVVEPDAEPAEPPAPQGLLIATARGPFPSIDAICAQLEIDHEASNRGDDDPGTCYDLEAGLIPDGIRELRRPRAPYGYVRFITTQALDIDCRVVMKIGGAWWLGGSFGCGSGRAKSNIEARVSSLAVADLVPGGSPEVVVKIRTTSVYDDDWGCTDCSASAVHTHIFDSLVICGVGPAGPACTEEILTAASSTVKPHRRGKTVRARADLRVTVDRGGLHVTSRGDTAPLLGHDDNVARLAGVHPIVWP